MLIEHRAYTPRPGNLAAFLDAQIERGFTPIQPVLDRLIGYFITCSGPEAQVVHLYRFDDVGDWFARLHGLYRVPALQPYFQKVRPLLVAQESKFLAPAPQPALTPVWGNGRDWLPGEPIPAALRLARDAILEETTLQLAPGGVPAYFAAFEAHALRAGALATAHGIGCFTSLVGRLHQVVQYRAFASLDACERHAAALRASTEWQAFQQAIAAITQGVERKLMTPAPIREMSPLVG